MVPTNKIHRKHKRPSYKVRERRAIVSDLYKKRYSRFEIAQIVGVNRCTVTKDILALQKQWMAQAIDNIHVVRLRELADLESMEQECIDRLNQLKSHPHQGSRWMEERRKIKERRSRMLGLDTEQRYVVRKEVTIINKAKRDEIVLAALGNRLPPGFTRKNFKDALKELPVEDESISDAEYEEYSKGN